MFKTITHKHLKRQFEIFEENDDFTDLFNELQFSTLLLPQDHNSSFLTFPILYIDEKKYAPVFTEVHEYDKIDFGDSFTLTPHRFDFYLDLLDGEIDGIIVDVEGERFPLFKDLEKFINPGKMQEASNSITSEDIRKIRKSVNNREVEEFLMDESNHWDYGKLLKLLSKSYLFNVVLSSCDITSMAEDGIICLDNIGKLPSAITSSLTENYALLYTGESEVVAKNNPMHPYLQLVNLPEFIENVLLGDLDGIVLNENSQNIHIPRQFLFEFIKNLDEKCNDNYDSYAFLLKN